MDGMIVLWQVRHFYTTMDLIKKDEIDTKDKNKQGP